MTQIQHNIDALASTLRSNPDLPVIFTLNGHTISPGYHITEVKKAVINSLDCGQGTDRWNELVIQLLDGSANSTDTYMRSAKMMGILEKALNGDQAVDSTNLYFEFSPGNAALQKSKVTSIEIVNNAVEIVLGTTTAQCKPYQRALASGKVSTDTSGCCGSAPVSDQACCSSDSSSANSACCT